MARRADPLRGIKRVVSSIGAAVHHDISRSERNLPVIPVNGRHLSDELRHYRRDSRKNAQPLFKKAFREGLICKHDGLRDSHIKETQEDVIYAGRNFTPGEGPATRIALAIGASSRH